MVTLTVAHEVRSIAQPLIAEHHPHLLEASILYVFTDQKRKRCDRVRLGSAAKMNALQRFLGSGMDSVEDGQDFIVLIDENYWAILGSDAQRALVDHELCHCALFVKDTQERPPRWRRFDPRLDTYDEAEHEYRWGMRGHDIEEFGEVLHRHGFWKPDERERYVKAVALQLVMPGDDHVAEPVATNGVEHEQPRRGRSRARASV